MAGVYDATVRIGRARCMGHPWIEHDDMYCLQHGVMYEKCIIKHVQQKSHVRVQRLIRRVSEMHIHRLLARVGEVSRGMLTRRKNFEKNMDIKVYIRAWM
jgi:hypothetical protein